MRAEVLTIGDELLRGEIVDSNKSFLSDRLLRFDIETRFHASVCDDPVDMTDAFRDPRAAAALVSYVMFRVRSVCARDARPHLVFIDETAPMLEDDIFRKNVEVLFREHRKLRGSINVVFQDVGALLKSGIAETVFNNCPTQFIFQNPNAREEDYAALELTPAQWEYVKGTSRLARNLRRSVLVKRGREAVILDIDMSALGPYLKVYRSGAEPVKLMRELQQKWGADKWLAEYLGSV